jgi:hypothetical protein
MEVSFMKNECSLLFCTRSVRWRGLACLALLCIPLAGAGFAQAPSGNNLGAQLPTLSLFYGAGKTLTVRTAKDLNGDGFLPVVVYADQSLQVRLQFGQAFAGQTIFVGTAEEEGSITTPTNAGALTIGRDGSVTLGYKAPYDPGNYHLGFRFGSRDVNWTLLVRDTSEIGRTSLAQRAE